VERLNSVDERVRRCGVDVRPGIDQCLDRFGVAEERREMQRCEIVGCPRLGGAFVFGEDPLEPFDAPERSRLEQIRRIRQELFGFVLVALVERFHRRRERRHR